MTGFREGIRRLRPRLPVVLLSLCIGLLTLLPYGIAYAYAGEYRFAGFLTGPYDAASYLAKMRQGFEGQILYTLAFTEDIGPGALIFTYYILLGHAARLFHLPLIAVWHAARILGATFFLTVAWDFFGQAGLSPRARALAWIITALGSGFGFLIIPLGTFTADLWVSEYIPFLGMLNSAHFPLATGLILLLAMQIALPPRRMTVPSLAGVFLLGAALGILQPFGFLPIGLALAGWILWHRAAQGRFPEGAAGKLIAAGCGVFPWAAYDLWITRTLPQFSSWFAQNQTPTPPVWDIAVSMGLPGLLVGFFFLRWIADPAPLRRKLRSLSGGNPLLGLWLAGNLLLLYAPIPLQRRLMLGMWIPLAALAAPKLESLLFRPALCIRYAVYAAIPLCAANLVFLSALRINALGHNPWLFLSPEDAAAVDWLDANAHGSVVLGPPELSMWLPGMAGVRVVYGHPMETPGAEQALRDVEDFFSSTDADTRLLILAEHQVDWVVCTTDSPACAAAEDGPWTVVFTSGSVKILSVQ